MGTAAQLRALGIDPARCTVNGRPVNSEPEVVRERMNKTETLYSLELEADRKAGRIKAWWFGSMKLRLADKTWYAPDFFIVLANWTFRFVEVKGGFVRDDAAVKFKCAREMYPCFDWLCEQRVKGGWKELFTR